MTPREAKILLDEKTQNLNLRKHGYAVAAIMRKLAEYFKGDADMWETAGYLHDADYDMYKNDPKKHPSAVFEWLKERNVDPAIPQAVASHAWGWREDLPKPETRMDWALFTCDELSGLITACALVRPDKQLSSLSVESVLKKFSVKLFAAGAKRENIMYCEKELGIGLPEFIGIALGAMQERHEILGL